MPFRTLFALAVAVALTPLLTGCPGDVPTGAATAANPNATAPTRTASAPARTTANTPPAARTAQTAPAAAPRTAAQTAQDLARAQQVQLLITRAENDYRSGVANYQANHLEAARLDFDSAIDAMLSSGFDLKTDGPLADEFDRILTAINTLEIAALKQGNGLTPKLEASPLDAANAATDITFPANPELVARLRSELNTTSDLPLVINDQVAGYIGVFSGSSNFRAHMAASLQRVGKYRGLIQNTLKEEGVPQDIIYLAVAESGFQPQALNRRSGAGGMWQFMTFTGAEYGLTRNAFYDYRFDPEKSTRAYAKYMKKLYALFGDWYLAMAAYDWGPGAVQHAIERTGYADYWELYRRNAMPGETRAYVPQILAAVIMAKNPERYGLDKLVPSPPVIYDTVSTSYAIDLRLVSDVTGASVQELVALNPALLRLSTPRDISFDLHIPPGTTQLYNDRLKDIPLDRRAAWRFHVVRPGETLDAIATSLHAKPADIAQTNDITAADPIATGDELVVPVAAPSAAAVRRYTPRRGDTLVTIADRFNVTVEDLRSWNGLRASTLRPGHSLYVSEPIRLAPSAAGRGRRGRSAASSRSSRTGSARSSRTSRKGSRGNSAQAASHKAAPASRTHATAAHRKGRK